MSLTHDLLWLLKIGTRGSSFSIESPYVRSYRLTKNNQMRHMWGRSMSRCIPSRRGPSARFLRPPTDTPHGMTHSNLILHDEETRWEENVYRLATPKALDETVCDTKTNAQSVCGSQPRCYAVCLVCEWWYVGRTVDQQVTWRFVADAYTSGVWRGQRSQVPAFT